MTGAVSPARPPARSHLTQLTPTGARPCVISIAPIDAIASRQGPRRSWTLISGDRELSRWNFISNAHRIMGLIIRVGVVQPCCVDASPLWLCHPSARRDGGAASSERCQPVASCPKSGTSTHTCINEDPKLPKIETLFPRPLPYTDISLVTQPPGAAQKLGSGRPSSCLRAVPSSLVSCPPSGLFREGLEAITVSRALARCTMRSVPLRCRKTTDVAALGGL